MIFCLTGSFFLLHLPYPDYRTRWHRPWKASRESGCGIHPPASCMDGREKTRRKVHILYTLEEEKEKREERRDTVPFSLPSTWGVIFLSSVVQSTYPLLKSFFLSSSSLVRPPLCWSYSRGFCQLRETPSLHRQVTDTHHPTKTQAQD